MALIKAKAAVTATGVANGVRLGDAGSSSVTTWCVQITGNAATFTGKFAGILRDAGSTLAHGTDDIDLSFTNATSGSVVAGGTGFTANGIYWVRADGCDVVVYCSAIASGTMEVSATPVAG